jgi:orotate phosphoribosyltransferase
MITQESVLDIFRETGVLQEGHFLLTSGRHSDRYMQCAKVFQYARHSEALCRELASLFEDVSFVIGPAVGAIQMAYEVSRHLGCRNIFAERENGVFTLRRGFEIEKGERALVVEDTVTTGGSVAEIIALVRERGAELAGVCSLVDRSGGKVDFGAPFKALVTLDIPSWEAESCPLCALEIPLVKPGSKRA